nr:probable cyclic nucleotide-gated ion channel 5 [Tanacetum cinerariifolium]
MLSSLRGVLLQQMDLQSLNIRLEEIRIKRRESEQWMHHMLLPQDLRQRVRRHDQYKRRHDQYKRLETREVDESNIVQNLPNNLRRDIKRHLCPGLVKRIGDCCISYLEVGDKNGEEDE